MGAAVVAADDKFDVDSFVIVNKNKRFLSMYTKMDEYEHKKRKTSFSPFVKSNFVARKTCI